MNIKDGQTGGSGCEEKSGSQKRGNKKGIVRMPVRARDGAWTHPGGRGGWSVGIDPARLERRAVHHFAALLHAQPRQRRASCAVDSRPSRNPIARADKLSTLLPFQNQLTAQLKRQTL